MIECQRHYMDNVLSKTEINIVAALIAAIPLAAMAAGPVVPDAGSILQQIKPAAPPTPSPSEPSLKIEPEGSAEFPPSTPFDVKSFKVTGNMLFDAPTLHALVVDAEGTSLTLSSLIGLATRISTYYHNHGYPLARAIIPAQTIQDGVVNIEVIEARYGQIHLDNHGQVDDKLLQATLDPLQRGQVIGQAELDRVLLLLSDIPGIVTSAILKPGQTVGTADIGVNIAQGPFALGNAALEDNGNRYTGRARLSGSENFINLLHYGDILTVSGLSSGRNMNYGRIAYDVLLNGMGTRVGGSYSALQYRLGGTLSSLKGHGTAQVESAWVRHPFMRGPESNLYGQIQYDQKRLQDDLDTSGIRTDRHLANWTASLTGNLRDAFLSGALNTWSMDWTAGQVGFDNGAAQSADAATAKTRGGFSKWNANFTRLQSLGQTNELFLDFSGQWANKNLDSAEKMTAGGAYTVRAYDMGAISGTSGIFGSAEFRHDLGLAWGGRWQAIAFLDSEHVTINKNTWATGTNSATLSGVGVGLNWAGPDQWDLKSSLAAPIGSIPALVGTSRSTRMWVEIGRNF